MQRNQMSSQSNSFAGPDTRGVIAMLGIILTGIVSAIVLPLWVAAPLLLFAVGALRVIVAAEPALEPVVIRRDERS